MKSANIDFLKILKNSWSYVWKYKFLWLLGLLAGGGGLNYSGGNFSYLWNGSDTEKLKNLPPLHGGDVAINNLPAAGRVLGGSTQDTTLFFAIVALLILVFALLFIYLNITAQGAIIKSVERIDSDRTIKLGQSWHFGHKYFWRVLGFSLFYGLVLILLPLLVLSTPVVIFAVSSLTIPAIIFGVLFFLVYFVYVIYLALIMPYAIRLLVLEDYPVIKSITKGFHFFNKNWKNAVLMYLIILAVMTAASIVLGIALLISGGILVLIGVGMYLLNTIVGIIYTVIFGLALFIALMIAAGLISSYQSTVLTLTYRNIKALN